MMHNECFKGKIQASVAVFGATDIQARVGLWRILGCGGHGAVSDTQKIDIVSGKRICVTQNTEHYIVMLLVSVCRYDLACQSLLSGIIACTTFRRLRMLVPH